MNNTDEKKFAIETFVYFFVCLGLCTLTKKTFRKKNKNYNPIANAFCMTTGKIIGDALYEEIKARRDAAKAAEE